VSETGQNYQYSTHKVGSSAQCSLESTHRFIFIDTAKGQILVH